MKLAISCFISILFSFSSYSQNNDSNKSLHYVLPEFTEGTILMKDGSKVKETLNYNALSENFALKKEDKILAVSKTDIAKIDTVYVADRKFFRKNNVFLELLIKANMEVYLEHKCNLESSTAASSGYGGTSQTTSGRTMSSIENRGNLYELELPEIYKAKPYKIYWINKEGVTTTFKTLSQLKKLYKDKKKEIKTYRKSNDVDVKDSESITKLLNHLEAID